MARMSAQDYGLLFLLSVIWGGSFFFSEVALVELPPLTLVFLRVLGGALTLHFIIRVMGKRFYYDVRMWRDFFIMGALANAVPFVLIVWGQIHIASGLASILNAMTPISTAIVTHLLTKDERLTPLKTCGVLAGFAGVSVLLGPALLKDLGSELWGQLAVVSATVCYALAGVFGRRFKGEPAVNVAAGQVTAASLLLLPVALFIDMPWTLVMPGLNTWAAIIGLGVLCTAVAYILFFRILANAGANNVMLVTFLVPPSAIVLGVLFLNERLSLSQLGGMALIGLALTLIDGRLFKAKH